MKCDKFPVKFLVSVSKCGQRTLFGRNLKYSKTKEQVQVAMQDFGKSETERLREVVKEFGKKYPTFEKIKDDFPVMMVCTSTNHAQKVWYIALLCSNLKLLQCRGVNPIASPFESTIASPFEFNREQNIGGV